MDYRDWFRTLDRRLDNRQSLDWVIKCLHKENKNNGVIPPDKKEYPIIAADDYFTTTYK